MRVTRKQFQVLFLLSNFILAYNAFSQTEWTVGTDTDTGWALRKQPGDSVYRRFFAIGSDGVPGYTPLPHNESGEPDSLDFINATSYFNISFVQHSYHRKTFQKNKPVISGYTAIHYLWSKLNGYFPGLGNFVNSDNKISYEEMMQIRNSPGAFAEQLIEPVIKSLKKDYLDQAAPYDLIWYLSDEPERNFRHWYWSPENVKLFHDEVKKVAPYQLTFVDLGPVEGSNFLYDYYLREQHGVSLPDTLKKDTTCGDGVNYCTYRSTIDGQKISDWVPTAPDDPAMGGRCKTLRVNLSDSLLRKQITVTTQAYSVASDILGINSYGFFNQHPRNAGLVVQTIKEAAPDKPLWVYFQAYERNHPGIDALRCQVYTAIIHGATGILFFNNDDQATILTHEVKELSRELLEHEATISSQTIATKLNGDLRYIIKAGSGPPRIIATNLGDQPLTLDVPDFPSVIINPLDVIVLTAYKMSDKIIINEVMMEPSTAGNGEHLPWVELHNPTNNDIDLNDYSLQLLKSGQTLVEKIGGVRLMAHGYATIPLKNDLQTTSSTGKSSVTSKMQIRVLDSSSAIIDSLTIPLSEPTRSVGRDPNQMYNILHFNEDEVTQGKRNFSPGFWSKGMIDWGYGAADGLFNPALVYKNKMWLLIGSGDSQCDHEKAIGVFSSVDGKVWNQLTDKPPFSKNTSFTLFYDKIWAFDRGGTLSSDDGKIWTLESTSGRNEYTSKTVTYKNSLWYIDGKAVINSTDGRTWSIITHSAPWSARNHPELTVHNGKMYLLGGYNDLSGEKAYARDVWSSDDGIKWTLETELASWPGREGFTSISFAGKIWIMGGKISNSNFSVEVLNDVWTSVDGVYWKQLRFNHVWRARSNHLAWVANQQVWVTGGECIISDQHIDDFIWTGIKQNINTLRDSAKVLNYGDSNIEILPLENVFMSSDNPDILRVEGATVSAVDVGTVNLSVYCQDNDQFYSPFEFECQVNIVPRDLSVTAADTFKTYGDPTPELRLKFEGFAFDDDVTCLGQFPSLENPDTLSTVGVYTMRLHGGHARKYNLNFKEFKIEVKPRKLMVTARDTDKEYGEENPAFEIDYEGFAAGDNPEVLEQLPTAQSDATQVSGVGEYTISLIGGYSPNYQLIKEPGKLAIRPKRLIAYTHDISRAFGSPNPELPIFYEGFIFDDGVHSLTAPPKISIHADQFSPEGTYAIELNGGEAANYEVVGKNSELKVTPGNSLVLYPNPVVDKLNIITPFNSQDTDYLEFFSHDGTPVPFLVEPMNSNAIQILFQNLTPGVYLYHFYQAGIAYRGRFIWKGQ